MKYIKHDYIYVSRCLGGTVDITTVKINDDKTMQQVYKSNGGPWGGTKVNEKFEMFLVELIGAETMKTFVEKHAIDYYDLRMDFESRKREVCLIKRCLKLHVCFKLN